jgi:TonB-linked SusC/RagA family outer membrane protein
MRKKHVPGLIIKQFLFLFLIFPTGLTARNQTGKVTLALKNASVKELFEKIQQQTNLNFVYNAEDAKALPSITLTVKDESVKNVLDKVFKDSDFIYKIEGNIISIHYHRDSVVRSTPSIVRIRGVVLDENREALVGASIQLKGTTTGMASDLNGRFEFLLPTDLPLPQTFIFSFLGFEKKEVVVKDTLHQITVVLNRVDMGLNDVVVTGYSNIRKSSFTGTSVKVTREELLKVSSGNVLQSLQVFDPSVRTVRNLEMGSDPNTLPEFNIRGAAGIGITELDRIEGADVSQFSLKNNPNLPVFILDGYEVSTEKIYDMDVNRIESITILKDAAATAMYGSRAANGVIVIETISPQAGKLRVSYNATVTVTAPDLSSYNMMNAREKLNAEVAAGLLAERSSYYEYLREYWGKLGNIERGVDTYWLSQPLQTQINTRHSLFVEGGAESLRFGLGVNYDAEKGIMKDSYRDRMGADLRVDYRVHGIQITDNVSYSYMKSQQSPYGSFYTYVQLEPYFPIRDLDTGEAIGTTFWVGNTGYTNPLYDLTKNNYDRSGYNQFSNNLSVNAYFLEYFQLKFQFATTYMDNSGEKFIDPTSTTFSSSALYNNFNRGELYLNGTKTINWNTNLMLMYNRSVKSHNINLNLALNANNNSVNTSNFVYNGFPSGQFHDPMYAAGLKSTPVFGDDNSRLVGGFLMGNYTYRNIYLLDVSMRMDGSSKLGADQRFAPFWSFGTGLNLHNYDFMKAFPFINNARIKGNYGETGRVSFQPYAARNTYRLMMDDWYTTGMGGVLIAMGNDQLTWDKVNTLNLGLDLTLWNRLTFNFSWYDKRTHDMVTNITIPSASGFTSYTDNMGEVSNKGYEINMNLAVLKGRDWGLNIAANGAHNHNEIVKISEALKEYNDRVDRFYENYRENTVDPIYNEKYLKPVRKYEEGGSEYAILGMKSLGIDPATGSELFMNRDGSVTYDWNASEQTIIGNTEPLLQGSFSFNGRYKNFSLYTTFMYEFGGDLYNSTLVSNVESVDIMRYNVDRRVMTDRWQKPGDLSPFKSISDRYSYTRPSSRFVQKNNMLTFNSVSLGYDLDRKLIKQLGLSMLRLQLTMNEIAVLSSIHQERGTSYPFARKFGFTLNASF